MKLKQINLLIFIHVVFMNRFTIGSEVFTSASEIKQAIEASQIIVEELKQYLEREVEHVHQLRTVIKRLENGIRIYLSSSTDKNKNDEVIEAEANPVSSFLTIIQLSGNWTSDLANILGVNYQGPYLNSSVSTKFNDVESRRKIFNRLKLYADLLPGTNDIDGASDAILRLQHTYAIPAINIADGKMVEYSTSPKLSDFQCFRLAKFSYNKGDYSIAEEWLKVILDRIDSNTSIPGNSELGETVYIPKEAILEYTHYALGRQGRYRAALEVTKKILDIDPNHENAIESKEFYEAELVRLHGHDPLVREKDDLTPDYLEINNYEQLCRGENATDTVANPKIVCKNSVPHPYFYLHPVKEEIIQVNPRIVLFHEFLTVDEVKYIRELSKRNLQRATVLDPMTGDDVTASYRITKNFWIPNDVSPMVKSINKRISMITGLNLEHAEKLQVANYGLGGHYAPHFDHARNSKLDDYQRLHGNRIATFMIYLTNIKAGGSTVFTRTKARVQPVERSAVFWYNLLYNGEGDNRMRHAGCPVLVGSKWVVNKWIRQYGQEFVRPCKLTRYLPEEESGKF